MLFRSEDRADFIASFDEYDLLIIDDLGVERSTCLLYTSQQSADISKKRRRLAAAQKRAGELEKLICKIYEDNACLLYTSRCV